MIGDDETNFPRKLSLTNTQVVNLRKAFAGNSSNDIKLSKTQMSKMIKSGGLLGRFFGSLLKSALLLTKNVIKPLAKSVLISLGLTTEYIKKSYDQVIIFRPPLCIIIIQY